MKLNFLILVLLVVSCVCQERKLHNVIKVKPVEDDAEDNGSINPTSIIIEKIQQKEDFDPSKFEYTEMCKVKEGFVGMMSSEEYKANTETGKVGIIHAKQVFAVLNTDVLTLFENHNVNSVLQTVNIRQVGVAIKPQSWKNFHCFQLVSQNMETNPVREFLSEQGKEVDTPSQDAVVSFCLGSEEKMNEWIKAIADFGNCNVKVTGKSVEINGLVTIKSGGGDSSDSSSEISQLEKEKEDLTTKITKITTIHDSGNQQYEEKKSAEEEKQILETTTTKITKQIIQRNAEENKIRRQMVQEQEDLQKETKKLESEQDCLTKMLRNKQEAEIELNEAMIREEQQTSEAKLLTGAVEVLNKDKIEETKKLAAQHEILKRQELQKQEELKSAMVKQAVDSEIDTNSDECSSDELKKDKDGQIKNICAAIARESGVPVQSLSDCLQPENFCNSCCNAHHGDVWETKRKTCRDSCESAMNPVVEEVKTETTEVTKVDGEAKEGDKAEAGDAEKPKAADEAEAAAPAERRRFLRK